MAILMKVLKKIMSCFLNRKMCKITSLLISKLVMP